MFSKACEHGIRAIIYIATQSLEGVRVKIGDVASNTGSPEAYTGKILGALTKFKVVNSITGPNGGFEIDISSMHRIKVSDIVFAIDGDSIYNGCALGLSQCDELEPCPLHENFVKIRDNLKNMLENTNVYDLATKLKSGKVILVR